MRMIGLSGNIVKKQGGAHARAYPVLAATLALAACLGGITETAYAGPLDTRAVSCTVNNGGTTNKGNQYYAYSSTANVYTLSPTRTTQPMPAPGTTGSVLFSTVERVLPQYEGASQGYVAPLYNCPPGTQEYFRGNGSYDSNSRSYATGLQGIGYRVYYYIGNGEELAAPQTFENTYATGALVFPMSSSSRGTYRTRIDFVATGATIKPGIIYGSNIFGQASVSTGTAPAGLYRVGMSGNITVSAPTCKINNPQSQTIALGNVTVSAMNSGAGENAMYVSEMQVDCGMSSQASPTVKLTTNYAASGSSDTVTNQAQNGAQGVGVRLWLWNPGMNTYERAAFNSTLPNRGTLISSTPNSTWSYKVGASYLRTGGTVTAGSVLSTATITFTYS